MEPEARVLSDAGHYRECLLSILNSARSEILVEYYIFADDEFGAALLQELERRAREGVEVRLLVDGFGSRQWLTKELENLGQLPFPVRVYHPVPWSLPTLRQAMRRWRDFLFCLGTANRRNHRKVVVVDGRKAILGSHNAWNESLDWHEASLLLSGPCVGAVRESFERIWMRSSDLEGRHDRVGIRHRFSMFASSHDDECKAGILDNTTVRRSRVRSRTILRLVAHAERRLWIATPYLLPHRTMLKHIRKLAEDGVDVRLILPRRSDVCLSKWMAQSLYSDLLESGVQIHEFKDSVLHAKVMLVDDVFVLGSSNMNHRSFFQDLEIDYMGSGAEELGEVVQWAEWTLTRCERIDRIVQVRLFRLKRCLAFLVNPLKGFL